MHRTAAALCATLLCLPLWACEDLDDGPGAGEGLADAGGGAQDGSSGQDSSSAGKDGGGGGGGQSWTIFVYGHADHNLSPSLVKDMAEMNAASFGDHIRVIVMADWDASAQDEQGVAYPKGTEWYRVMGSGAALKPYKTVGEQNLDDPKVLTAAITEAFSQNKADRYGLLLWDHGGAWSGGYGHDTQDGTSDGDGIDAETLAKAIAEGLQGAGIQGERPLEFLSFDTCLMAGVEIAAPLQKLAKVYIANAEIDYGDGWNYQAVLELLSSKPGIAAVDFAQAEVAIWDAHHKDAGIDDKLIRSHVALDLSKWAGFSTAFRGFSDAVYLSQKLAMELFGLSAFQALPVYSAVVGDPTIPSTLRDLGQFMDSMYGLSDDDTVSAKADAVRKTLDDLVIARSVGDVRKSQLGLHLLLGLARELPASLLGSYQGKAKTWDGAAEWASTLAHVAKSADNLPPVTEGQVKMPAKPTAEDPPVLEFSTQDKDVAMAKVSLLAAHPQDASKLLILGTMGIGAITPGAYEFGWDGTYFGIDDGAGDLVPASPAPWLIAGTKSGDFAAPLYGLVGVIKASDGEKIQGTLLFGADATTAGKFAFGDGTQASVLGLKVLTAADPNVTFTPLLVMVDVKTGQAALIEAGEGVKIPASGELKLAWGVAEAGTYYMGLETTDVWGNSGFALHAMTIQAPFGG